MPLAYGMEGSYSLKYNILFDKLFGFELIGGRSASGRRRIISKRTNAMVFRSIRAGTIQSQTGSCGARH